MATVTGLTAPRMLEIEANSIVSGTIDIHGDLILTTHGGDTINAGQVEPTRFMGVTDSASIDLGLTGAGSIASPWALTASVKVIDASKVTTGVFDIARIPNLTLTGLLEASYRGGPAKVKVAGILSTEAYRWQSPYIPGASRVVRLTRVGTTWEITGQTQDGYYSLPLNETNFGTYSANTGDTIYSSRPRVTRLPSGIVSLSGLLHARGATSDNMVVATLPADCRPDYDMIAAVEVGDVARSINIKANGDITVRGNSWGINQYVSLDGVQYPAAGVATWTPFGSGGSTWGANFSADSGWSTTYGPPAYWKDPYGFVWFRGLVKIVNAVSVDNTRILDLPSTHRSYREQHLRTTGNDGYSGVGANALNGLNWKIGSVGAAGAWLSLGNVVITTTDAWTNNPWYVPAYVNGWTDNGSAFPTGAYVLREDGLCVLSGLMIGGSQGLRIAILRDSEMWPRYGRILFSGMSNNARGRIDIGGERDSLGGQNVPGGIVYTQGVNGAWFSLDGRMWVP